MLQPLELKFHLSAWLFQSYTIASRNSQFLFVSVSIGLATFPDKIYTDATLYTENKPILILFKDVKKKVSRLLFSFVGNRYINARLYFRYPDLTFALNCFIYLYRLPTFPQIICIYRVNPVSHQ